MTPNVCMQIASARGLGRRRGTSNKMTSQVKEAILETFTIVGGEKCLGKIAEDDQHIFCTLLCKVLAIPCRGQCARPDHLTDHHMRTGAVRSQFVSLQLDDRSLIY